MKLKKHSFHQTLTRPPPPVKTKFHFGSKIEKRRPPYAPALCALTGWGI